ncbi:MAG: tetratricopeptide repeat protein [Burkholderiales bacterium]|nr:tetratricopeptide repeat protein [Burkholderiales bacterium]
MKQKKQGMNRVKARSGLALALLATALVTGCFDPSPEQYIKTGKARLEKSDARGAAIEFKNALQKDPSVVEARFLLASALLKLGDAVGAAVELEKVEKAGYDNNLVAPVMARALMQQGKSDALLAKYKDTVLTQPAAMAELQVILGRVHLAANRLEDAKVAGKKALEAAPESLEAQQLQVRITAAGGGLPAALEQTRALIAKLPNEHSNWLMLGDLQLAGGDPKQARQSYEEAIKRKDKDVQPYFSLMPLLLLGGDLPAAASNLAAV